MSSQRQAKEKAGKNNYRYFTPIRGLQNAVALKSLYVDVDYKGGEHGYANQAEAVRELARFLKATGLPKPSVVVHSGGGIHCHWVMSRALSLAEWQPLAHALAEATKRHGFHCDPQVSVDGTRILRVPCTHNYKQGTPRPVQLLSEGLEYSVEHIAQALELYKVARPKPAAPF